MRMSTSGYNQLYILKDDSDLRAHLRSGGYPFESLSKSS